MKEIRYTNIDNTENNAVEHVEIETQPPRLQSPVYITEA